MSEEYQPALGWAGAWADLQDRGSEFDGSTLRVDPVGDSGLEYILTWPGPDADRIAARVTAQPGSRLTLVGADDEAISDFADSHGLHRVATRCLVSASTAEMNQAPVLPEDAQIAEAPMDAYDAVELSIFDHPVAGGRVRVGTGFALVQITDSPGAGNQDDLADAVLATMAENAFEHGAERLYMVVDPVHATRWENSGWKATLHVLSFEC